MKRTDMDGAIAAMEDAGWRWAGMSRDKVFFDRKTRDPETGKSALEWKEFTRSAASIKKFLGSETGRKPL